jgi:hypothetical protein
MSPDTTTRSTASFSTVSSRWSTNDACESSRPSRWNERPRCQSEVWRMRTRKTLCRCTDKHRNHTPIRSAPVYTTNRFSRTNPTAHRPAVSASRTARLEGAPTAAITPTPADPPAHAQHRQVGALPGEDPLTHDLVHGVVASDVLAHHDGGTVVLEESSRMQAPRGAEHLLCFAEPFGQRGDQRGGDLSARVTVAP